jgi:hypothetical protein
MQGRLKTLEEGPDVGMGRVVIQDFVSQALKGAIVHDGKHGEGAVVEPAR